MIYFTAHTFKCVCHCIRTMFRVLGVYNFVWKYNFGTFWQTVITRRNFLKIFPWWHIDSWPKTLLFRILVVKSNTVQSFFGRIYGAAGAAICFRFYLTLNRDMLLLRTLWYLENLSNCNNSVYHTHPISQLKLCQQLFMG